MPPFRLPCQNEKLARRRSRPIFRFTDLPPEIRNLVYGLVFDFSSIEKYFSTYTNMVTMSMDRNTPPPECCKACPGVLLVNKEVYTEARPYLYKTPLVFTHGIIKSDLSNIICDSLLRNITDITITDAGLDLLDPTLMVTFHGVQLLLQQLARVLHNGHNLKRFKLAIKAKDFNWHIRHCANQGINCGITDFLSAFKSNMGTICGIEKVEIEGDMSITYKQTMVNRMQRKPAYLYKLPLHVRERIYAYAACPSDASKALNAYILALKGDPNVTPPLQPLTTPNILLLNHQFLHEARRVIRTRPVRITASHTAPKNPNSLWLFFNRKLFHQIQHLELDFCDWQFILFIPELARVLFAKHALKSLRLHIRDSTKYETVASGFSYPDITLATMLHPLSRLRGIKHVEITGDLPDCYVLPLKLSMMRPLGTQTMPLWAFFGNGEFEELNVREGSQLAPIEVE